MEIWQIVAAVLGVALAIRFGVIVALATRLAKKVCKVCNHKAHEPGKCSLVHIYSRGTNDPPGNQVCLCGVKIQIGNAHAVNRSGDNIWMNF